MRTVTNIAMAVVAALSVAACSHSSNSAGTDNPAQPGAAGAMSQGGAARIHRFGRILASLNLTDDERGKIKAIMADARAKTAADPSTRRDNMKAAMDQIAGILTPQQRATFEAQIQAMRRAPQQPAPSQ
jgi:Spy/CpxP family protein refolding chaperone